MCHRDKKNKSTEPRATRLVTNPQHRQGGTAATPQHAQQSGPTAAPAPSQQQPDFRHTPVPRITTQSMDRTTLSTACYEAGQVLRGRQYAVIGGAACALLGSQRGTADIDIIVPENQKRPTQRLLGAAQAFGYNSQVRRTWFNAPNGNSHNIDVIVGPEIGTAIDAQTQTMDARGARIMPPAVLLQMKCISWADVSGTRDQTKRGHDSEDIRFLLDYMVEHHMMIDNPAMQGINGDFFDSWLGIYPESREQWGAIGIRLRSW